MSGLYLLPSALGMGLLGTAAGRVSRRYGSKMALLVGSAVTAMAFAWMAVLNSHPYDMLISAALLGIGIGLAFSALGNLVVQAVPPHQTGVASGMNTVMRTLGGALGGQIAATFIANNMVNGVPTLAGFTASFVMATAFLVVCVLAGLLVPSGPRGASRRGAGAAGGGARARLRGREVEGRRGGSRAGGVGWVGCGGSRGRRVCGLRGRRVCGPTLRWGRLVGPVQRKPAVRGPRNRRAGICPERNVGPPGGGGPPRPGGGGVRAARVFARSEPTPTNVGSRPPGAGGR